MKEVKQLAVQTSCTITSCGNDPEVITTCLITFVSVRMLKWCTFLTGRPLVRINLSEQTDMMDLLGADLPVEGAAPGNFAWYVLLCFLKMRVICTIHVPHVMLP